MADAQTNKQVVIDFYDMAFVQQRHAEAVDRYFGARYIQHNPFVPDDGAGFKQFFTEVMPPRPGFRQEVLRVVAGEDMVAVHATIHKTPEDRGTVLVDWFRLEDGKIVEHWDVYMPIPDPATVPHGNGIL